MFYNSSSISTSHSSIQIKGEIYHFNMPRVMGILNLTTDSFYDGGRFNQMDDALVRTERMLQDGADIIDVGAASSRPGATIVSSEEELYRMEKIVAELRSSFPDAILSLDTYNAAVARKMVVEHGVDMINDISAGEIDKDMFATIADLKVPYIMMHMKGVPSNMQETITYQNILLEIFRYFSTKLVELRKMGVNDIIIDPGFGFGKTMNNNFELLDRLNDFKIFELPLMAGISRKSMISKALGEKAEDSLNGTTAAHMVALLKGANILRVHDVKEARECITIYNQLANKQA